MQETMYVTLGNGEAMQIPYDKGGRLNKCDEQPEKIMDYGHLGLNVGLHSCSS